jgi:hypothetical protein
MASCVPRVTPGVAVPWQSNEIVKILAGGTAVSASTERSQNASSAKVDILQRVTGTPRVQEEIPDVARASDSDFRRPFRGTLTDPG